jgi:GT2 family glycosyltransferase
MTTVLGRRKELDGLVNVDIVTIAYNSAGFLPRLFATAERGRHRIRFHLFLHSRHTPTVKACERLADTSNVIYYPYGINRGVSRSWNDGILNSYSAGADVVLIVNDDIYFSTGDVDKLAEKALQCRGSYIVTCAGFHLRFNRLIASQGYSCCAVNPIAIEKIGCFDENFFPAYCEDQDYAYRARLAGLSEENCPHTTVHHGGSCAIYADSILNAQNALTQGRNRKYYRRKWGGDAGYERYGHPFDDPEYDHFIPPQNRHTPYGPRFNRTDHNLVSI